MGITTILNLLGGIGMFLYGMEFLGDALKRAAGASLEHILERLTNNKIKGLALGTAVTAIIQSSAATAIIIIGFVNAGIMNLEQGLPVVFGSNIGSTVTGQLLRLGDIGSQNIILTLLKPSSFAPLLIAVGTVFLVFIKKKKFSTPASICLGLGLLFFGMTTMEHAISPLKDTPQFQQLFVMFENPFLGILAGMLLTMVIQSSSASVGILQAITSTGTVTWGLAIPIIIGQNIGKCLPVVVSSLSANRDSKKVAFLHVVFNIIGAVVWGSLIYLCKAIFNFSFWNDTLNRGNVADFHTLYNAATAILLLPFCRALSNFADRVLKSKKDEDWASKQFDLLNEMFLKTPVVALDQSRHLVCDMGEIAKENFALVEKLFENYDEKIVRDIENNESFLDRAETKLCEYLVKITQNDLDYKSTRLANELLRSIGDLERIGDYCQSLAEVVEFNKANGIEFTEDCKLEIQTIFSAAENILSMTVDSYVQEDAVMAARVEPLEEVIDSLKDFLADRHVSRLQNGECSVQAGISFSEILNSVERIAGHCANVAEFLTQRLSDPSKFDAHEHLGKHQVIPEEYKAMFTYYESIYYTPIMRKNEVRTPAMLNQSGDNVETAGNKKEHKSKKHGDKKNKN